MPATAKITADTSDYEQKIAAVKAKTVNASQEMSRAVDKFGKDVAKAGIEGIKAGAKEAKRYYQENKKN